MYITRYVVSLCVPLNSLTESLERRRRTHTITPVPLPTHKQLKLELSALDCCSPEL
jgi:hypothetical protein